MSENWFAKLLASGLFAIFLTFLSQALSAYGVISVELARLLLLFAWISGAFGIWISRQIFSFRPKIENYVVAILIFCLAGGLFAIDRWAANKKTGNSSQKIKTLHDLFRSNCHGDHVLSIRTFAPIECNGKPFEGVELMRCGSLEMKSEFFSVYIPDSPCTLGIMQSIDKMQRDMIDKRTPKFEGWYEPPGENKLYWKDIVETGRIYVYHQTEVASPERDRLAENYKKQGLDLIFRGRNYAIVANSPLYRTKDVK